MADTSQSTPEQDLREQVDSLVKRFAELALKVKTKVVEPLSRTELPDEATVDEASAAIKDFQVIAATAEAMGHAEEGQNLARLLKRLDQAIESRSWTAIQDRYRPDVERVLQIVHKNGQSSSFLDDLHGRARKCVDELTSPVSPASASREQWEERIRPFRDLWQLLTDPDGLHDAQAEGLLERLEKEFGRGLVPLIMLRRLIIRPDPTGTLGYAEPVAGQSQVSTPALSPVAEEPQSNTCKTEGDIQISATPERSSEPIQDEGLSTDVAADSIALPVSEVMTLQRQPAVELPATVGQDQTTAPVIEAPQPEPAVESPMTVPPTIGQNRPTAHDQTTLSVRQSPGVSERESSPVEKPGASLEPQRCLEIRNLIWRMVAKERLGLAFQLARCAGPLAPMGTIEPSSLLRAAVLGPAVRSSTGDVVDQLQKSVEDLQTWLPIWQNEEKNSLANQLLVFGLTLRPTLLAPTSGALSLLQELATLDPLSSGLGEIRRSIVEFGSLNLELSPGVLKGVRDHAVWQQQLEEIQGEAGDWLNFNRGANIIYAPTTDVWHRWLQTDRPLGHAAEMVVNNGVDHIDQVRRAIRHWSDKKNVEKELARTDEEIRKTGARRRPIEARARTAMCKRAHEFVHIAQRWLDAVVAEPHPLDDFRQQRADRCRNVIQQLLPSAFSDLTELANSRGRSESLEAALHFVRNALEDLGKLFDPHSQETTELLSVQVLLGEELLALADIPLDENWQPTAADSEHLLQRLEAASAQPFNPEEAFANQSKARNHLGTLRVIEALAARPDGQDLADRLRLEREDALHHCRQALSRQLEETRQNIEQAVCYDLITDEERARFLGAVEECRLLLDEVADFALEQGKLDDIDNAITEKRKQRILEVHQKLEATEATVSPDRRGDLELVRKALERGDFLSADEYIELVRRGQPLTRMAEPVGSVLFEFFPAFVQQFAALMTRQDPRDVADMIRERRTVGPLNMDGIPKPQAAEAAEMVTAWLRLKRRPENPAKDLTILLTAFGFRNVQVKFTELSKSTHWSALCECSPIGDPNVCIIPDFGSKAKGRYRILGLLDGPNEEAIVNMVKEVSGVEPVIVLYFRGMPEQRRRDLAALCWQRGRSFLTVDESLVFFLCRERFSRLPILFQCALPFTIARPYTTTASLVPVEMFFGREQERLAVVDPYGTNLVYGGRQLGKSALLRDVERREHNPVQGRIVRWIDLKNRGIGIDRPAVDVWSVLAQELHEDKVVLRAATTHQAVVSRIKEWLKGEPSRRILLLLDEADAFLEADSRHSFPEVAHLKGLMDDTDRRFKVVFAGLHNVQRAARDPNTPVAHLGTPVCIGPLLDKGEWRQARDLIDIPFRHMGYKFLPPDLWMRILSYTNYYPSLVQVFCKHLLEYLHSRDRTTFDFRNSPPYPVSVQQIEEVYQSDALQREIAHKFELTLGLDERYRLIALCIALASIEEREERALVDGFDVAWVREHALSWWPHGFVVDTSYELFRTILDEMIGLGILRRTGADRYALRSPNVLNLLGSKAQIEQRILDVAGRAPPASYEAASFHRSLNSDCLIRSPLTAEQEASLIEPANGVAVVYGSRLSGLGQLHAALTAIPSQAGVRLAESVKNQRQLTEWLQEVDKWRSELEGVALAFIPPEAGWSSPWVTAAFDFLRRKTGSTKRFLRTVFVADPELAWKWMADDGYAKSGVSELSLRPWQQAALRRWIEDAEFGPEAVNQCQDILIQTGGWGMLVDALGEACRGNPHTWREQLEKIRLSWPKDSRWDGCFGLPQAVASALQVMADWDAPISSGEMATLVADSDVPRVLRWADRLAYVREVEPDRWVMDPLVRSAVKSRG